MSTLSTLVDDLETALTDYVDSERSRLETERDFLLAVLDGRADGVTVEDVSSDLTALYLSGSLGQYVPVEEDTDSANG